MKKQIQVLWLLLLCMLPAVAVEKEYDLYLLIGQSNMAGRGTLLEADRVPMEGVWLLNADDKPEAAVPPLNKYSTVRKDEQLQQMGLGVAFAQTIHAQTGRKVLLVVNARGGSSVKSWQPGERYYAEAVRRTQEALKYGDLKAILWHQGETDVKRGRGYLTLFGKMMTSLRAELEVPDNLPVIVGQLGRWGWADEAHIRCFNDTVLPELCEQYPYCRQVSSEGLPRLFEEKENDAHFSREGQLELGRRYAAALLPLIQRKQR